MQDEELEDFTKRQLAFRQHFLHKILSPDQIKQARELHLCLCRIKKAVVRLSSDHIARDCPLRKAGKRSSSVSLSGGEAEQINPDSTYVMGSSSSGEQQIPILQSFHAEHQRVTPTVLVESTGGTKGVDTLEHCRYFTTTGLALPPDKEGS
eukprot:scaffold7_cov414-Pavlova_lutheri.AAC.24